MGIAAAYDAIAAEYDRLVEPDAWMRERLWRHYLRCFRPGERVLDVACGTGIDTLFLAAHGLQVLAIDVSPGMIARLKAKAEHTAHADRVEARVLDASQISMLGSNRVDGVVSAFAGLNTVSDLGAFAADAARLLRPDGRMVIHMLNRFSFWEGLGLVAKGQWAAARRLTQREEYVVMVGRTPVRHRVGGPGETYRRFFARDFDLLGAYGLGALRRTPAQRRVSRSLASALAWLDDRLAQRRPILDLGRFFVLVLARRSDRPAGRDRA